MKMISAHCMHIVYIDLLMLVEVVSVNIVMIVSVELRILIFVFLNRFLIRILHEILLVLLFWCNNNVRTFNLSCGWFGRPCVKCRILPLERLQFGLSLNVEPVTVWVSRRTCLGFHAASAVMPAVH